MQYKKAPLTILHTSLKISEQRNQRMEDYAEVTLLKRVYEGTPTHGEGARRIKF